MRPLRQTSRRRTVPKGRSSTQEQSCTFFHITALSQSDIERTKGEIEESVKALSTEEIVQAEFLEMFTDEDITNIKSLGSEEVCIVIGNVVCYV